MTLKRLEVGIMYPEISKRNYVMETGRIVLRRRTRAARQRARQEGIPGPVGRSALANVCDPKFDIKAPCRIPSADRCQQLRSAVGQELKNSKSGRNAKFIKEDVAAECIQ